MTAHVSLGLLPRYQSVTTEGAEIGFRLGRLDNGRPADDRDEELAAADVERPDTIPKILIGRSEGDQQFLAGVALELDIGLTNQPALDLGHLPVAR